MREPFVAEVCVRSGFVSGSGKRAAVNDVVVDALERDRGRLNQLVRQALEEQPPHEVDVPAGRAGDLVPALIAKRYLGHATIGRGRTALDEPSALETADVVREPAPLPADPATSVDRWRGISSAAVSPSSSRLRTKRMQQRSHKG